MHSNENQGCKENFKVMKILNIVGEEKITWRGILIQIIFKRLNDSKFLRFLS